jgi:hypothetical protein
LVPSGDLSSSLAAAPAAASTASWVRSSDSDKPPQGVLARIHLELADIELTDHPLQAPILLLRLKPITVTRERVDEVLGALEQFFLRQEPLFWTADLRELKTPPMLEMWGYGRVLLAWLEKPGVGHLINKVSVCIALVLSNWLVRQVVNWILSVTKPPFPVGMFSDEAAAVEFTNTHAATESMSERVAQQRRFDEKVVGIDSKKVTLADHRDVYTAMLYPEVVAAHPEHFGEDLAAAHAKVASIAALETVGPPASWPSWWRPPPADVVPKWDESKGKFPATRPKKGKG